MMNSEDISRQVAESTLEPALELMLARIRVRAKRRIAWLRKLWNEEGESGGRLAVTHAEIDTHLDNRDSPEAEAAWYSNDGQISEWNRELSRIEAEMAADKDSRLTRLRRIFGLNNYEFDLLQTCLAVILDPALGRVYAYLHDHVGRGYPTENLAARLFGHGRNSLWTSESPLRTWELVREKETAPGEPDQLVCDPFIRDWVQGRGSLDEFLVGIARAYQPMTPLQNWPVSAALSFIKRMVNNTAKVRTRIVGPPGSGRRTLGAIISSRLGLSLLAIDADQIDEDDWQRAFIRVQRQAYLNECAIAWCGKRAVEGNWPQVVPFYPVQFVICEHGQIPSPVPGVIDQTIQMPAPSLDERRGLWRRFVPASATWPEESFNNLVTQHRASIGDIVSVAQRDVQTASEAAGLIREAARGHLGDLAQLLDCPFSWDDLVVTENLREALEDLAFEARDRVAFWERDEARRLFPQGRGLLALFSGPPGTGKTMAAQVIAANLGLDLFRIDLSSVVSKYVGETSKNLERVLSRAALMDLVLLFDEADALFGKRTEIKDAHDRFANTDTGYLLQAIENYRGVAVLATNKKGNIDPAFIRRIRYVLEFPRPDVEQREQIWRRIVGELAGQDVLKNLARDLKALAAELELTGAQIKFAFLAAIFSARRDRKPLAMIHLLRGIDRELMKEGRSLSERERERLLKHVRD
jgi:hypothetical protein